MAIDTISRALSGQASTAAKQAKETADSAMEQAIAAVPGAVSDWLEDNVTPTTPVVDASLSIAGAAADAKATGDGIADLKSALNVVLSPENAEGTVAKFNSMFQGAPISRVVVDVPYSSTKINYIAISRTGINLLGCNRTRGYLSSSDTKRSWDESKYYLGYYVTDAYNATLDEQGEFMYISPGSCSVKSYGEFGVALPVRCKANTQYWIQGNWQSGANAKMRVSYYTVDGIYISNAGTAHTSYTTITTPSNAGWIVISLGISSSAVNTNTISGLMLEYKTDYSDGQTTYTDFTGSFGYSYDLTSYNFYGGKINATDGELLCKYDSSGNEIAALAAAIPRMGTATLKGQNRVFATFGNCVVTYVYQEAATPEMFGAIGDGTTDDTTAIQQAISAGFPVVRFGDKTYHLDGRLSIPSDVFLEGINTILEWGTITGDSAICSGQNRENVRIKGIKFDFGTQSTLRYSISLIDSFDITVTDCEFTGGYGYAWRINNDSNVLFEKCSFHNITGASGNPGGAIYGSDFHDASFINCYCDTIDDHFVYIAGVSDAYNVFVRGCTCIKTGQNGLTNGAAVCVYANAHEVIISDNIIKQCRTGVYAGQYGEYTTLPRNITICQNTITNATENGIHVKGIDTSYPCSNVHISDNTVYYASQDAIKIAHSVYCTIDNNLVQQPTRYGIALDRVYYSSITDCIITDVANVALFVGAGSSPCLYCRFENIYMTQKSGTYTSYGLYSRQANYCQYINITAIGFATNIYYGGGAYNNYINAQDNTESKSLYFTNDITKLQYHNVGDYVFASNPSAGNPVAWVCTVAGSPGTMTPIATLPS